MKNTQGQQPAETVATRYAYSFDEEYFHGDYASREEAAMEALDADDEALRCYVGVCVTPVPEDHIYADDIIEHVVCQEPFLGEWAEGWPDATKEQLQELTDSIRKVFGEWIDKHELRPTFYNVEDVQVVERQSAGGESEVAK